MALLYSGSTTDKVTVANPQTFGAGTAFTMLRWVRMESGAYSTNGRGMMKGSCDLGVYFGSYFANVNRAGTLAEVLVDSTTRPPIGTWVLEAITYDETNGVQHFTGTRAAAMVESTYVSQTVGTGDTSADSGDLYIGNRGTSASAAQDCTIAAVAWFNRRLTLAELKALQFVPIAKWNISGCVFLYDFHGTGNPTDRSGNARNGTITGCVSALHPPLVAPFAVAASGWIAGAADAGATDKPVADAGAGSDAVAVGAAVPLADTGTGSEALGVAGAVPATESGTASDGIAVVVSVELVDAAAGVDALGLAAAVPFTDEGAGVDGGASSVAIALEDAGAALEAFGVAAGVALADGGLAVDAVGLAAAVALADAGAAVDQGAHGGDMATGLYTARRLQDPTARRLGDPTARRFSP